MPRIEPTPAADYFADHAAWSQSMLKTFANRRRLAHAYYVTKHAVEPAPKDIMRKGTAVHTALLEPERFNDLVILYPKDILAKDGSVSTKAAKEFRDSHQAAGRIVLKDEAYIQVRAMAESVRRVCGDWLSLPARKEESIYWTCETTGLALKMRLDWLVINSRPIIFDLKTTADASPNEFRRRCEQNGYGIQQAHYVDGVEQVTGVTPLFYFIAVENEYPYACAIHQLDERSVADARVYRHCLLTDVKSCIESGDWSEPWEQRINTLSLRPFIYQAA